MTAIYCKELVSVDIWRSLPCGRPAKYKARKGNHDVCVCGIHKKRYEKRDYAIEELK
jgi:hypothetical protein